MNKNNTPLVDEYLESLQGMKSPVSDEFFYTRLRAKMERVEQGWNFPLKPVWLIATLVLFVSVNSVLIFRQRTEQKEVGGNNYSISQVSEAYNLGVSSSY